MHRNTRPLWKKGALTALALLIIAGLVLSATPMASAKDHKDDNGDNGHGKHGTIKILDHPDQDPPKHNNPHVSCEFWIAGFGMKGDEGLIRVYVWPPTGDKELVLEDEWESDEMVLRKGNDFLNGPYELPVGHYKVFVSQDHERTTMQEMEHGEGKGKYVKHKVFWVDPCVECPTNLEATLGDDGRVLIRWDNPDDATGSRIYRSTNGMDPILLSQTAAGVESYVDETTMAGATYTYTVASLFGDEESLDCDSVRVRIPAPPEPEPLPCPTSLGAIANDDGSILVTFTPAAGSNGSRIYRSTGDADPVLVGVLDAMDTAFLDTDTVPGTTYTYQVTGVFEDGESGPCPIVTVTAIPVFPMGGAALVASLAGIVAYAGLRRRF